MTEDAAISRFISETGISEIVANRYAANISRVGERVTIGRLRAEHRSATANHTA